MELIINLVLLATSGAAAFYCFVLNRKLDALRKTENGLGASIAAMSKGIEDARSAIRDANEASSKNILQLKSLIDEAKEISPKLDEMIDVISELSEITLREIAAASDDTRQTIESLVAEASASAETLRAELSLAEDVLDIGAYGIRNDEDDLQDDDVVFDIAPGLDLRKDHAARSPTEHEELRQRRRAAVK